MKKKIMKKIKFAHHYMKLLHANVEHGDSVKLLLCIHVNLEDLPKDFKSYDTDNGLFKIPKCGRYMLLIFQGSCGVFPTLRSEAKEALYYEESVGKYFEIHIESSVNKPKEERHMLACPYYDLGLECEMESPFIRTDKKGSDVFKCKEHGYFEIKEDGDIVTF